MSVSSLLQELHTRPAAARTLELLKQVAKHSLAPSRLMVYHEHLLFYKAYPPSKSIRNFCEKELLHFPERIVLLDEYSHSLLDLSGIVGTKMTYAYEFPLAKWIISKAGNGIDIDWELYEEREDDPLGDVLGILMQNSEGDAMDSPHISIREYMDAARGKRTALRWLMDQMERSYPKQLLWAVWDAMLLDLSYDLLPPAPSRTLVSDYPPEKLHLWTPKRKKFDFVKEARRPLKIPAPVSKTRARELLDMLHGALLVRLREFYGALRANLSEFYEIPVGRGVSIVPYFMEPEHRLPIEAGLGLLLMRNGVPIGYGAGGLHVNRNEIAINIFDTFRGGGDAALICASVARFCYALNGSPWVVIRKYQVGGEKNEEGIASGSFWFYDKLGFRSTDSELRALADSERKMIRMKKGYRTPKKTLRKLAQADVVLSLEGDDPAEFSELPFDKVSLLSTKTIAERYGGDRKNLTSLVSKDLRKLIGANYSGWTKSEKERFAQMGLFILAIPDLDNWSRRDLDKLIRLGRLKGSTREADHIRASRHNLRFYEALEKLV